MATVKINTYDPRVSASGAPLPEANLPGSYQLDMQGARTLDHLSGSLMHLANVELRLRDAAREDGINNAKVHYMNDIMREAERMGAEDTDYETQRERYALFQKDRQKFYADQMGDDGARQNFLDSVLIPSTRSEFEVGNGAMGKLNDRLVANFNDRLQTLTGQTGWNSQTDNDALDHIYKDLDSMVAKGVVSESDAQKIRSGAKNDIQLNQLSVMSKTNPEAIVSAVQGFKVNPSELNKDEVVGNTDGDRGAIKNKIYEASVAAGYDPRMFMGLAKRESDFNPNAKSTVDKAGRYAAGVFQFRGPAAKQVGLVDENGDRRFNADENINSAMEYMKYIEKTIPGGRGRPDLMIAAWKNGPNDPDIQAGKVPADAVEYVNDVLNYGYGADGNKGTSFAKDTTPYKGLLSEGYTTQQALKFVDIAEANINAQIRAAKEQSKIDASEAVNNSYSALKAASANAPDEESRMQFLTIQVNSILDPERRDKMKALLNSDMDAYKARQGATNQSTINSILDVVKQKGLSLNETNQYLQDNPDLVKQLDREGRKNLEDALLKSRKPNTSNINATQRLMQAIDKGGADISRDQILAGIYQADLTNEQSRQVLDYFEGGGKRKTANLTAVANSYKRLTESEKDMPADFYDTVLDLLPAGEPANALQIDKAVSTALTSGRTEEGIIWDTKVTYGEAVADGTGSAWLPVLNKEQKIIAKARMDASGITDITEHKMQVFWRESVMGLPAYKEAVEEDITGQFTRAAERR